MIPDLDIYRAAQVLVKHHGEDAPTEAATLAEALSEQNFEYFKRASNRPA